jgi:hypothetical protein
VTPWLGGLSWLAALLLATGPCQAQASSEPRVKAAFVFNFIKFVEWPAQATPGAIRLCTMGAKEPFLAAVAALDGKTLQNRELRVQRVSRGNDLAACQVLVLGESETENAGELLRASRGKTLLTISDIEKFADAGGIIGLLVVDERVQFEVNADAARQADLRMSSQVMKLARSVKGKP